MDRKNIMGNIKVKKNGNEKNANNKKNKKSYAAFMASAIFLGVIFAVCIIFVIVRLAGKNSLYKSVGVAKVYAENFYDKDENIEYNEKLYKYNSDIITFLVMGIDSDDKVPVVDEDTDYLMGGQSDAIFLFIMNPHDKSLSAIAINRNSMTNIYMCDRNGNYTKTGWAQLCVQHGYGDGRELSCERTRDAVSELLYGLPINAYVSMQIGAVKDLNKAVGGIEVVVPSDFPEMGFVEGQTVELDDEQAYFFLRFRDTTKFNSASKRLENNKVYLKAFMKKVFEKTKKDISYPIRLYNIVKDYVVTDITVDEMTFIASELLGYSISELKFYSLEGEMVHGKKYEEFNVDMEAAKRLILDVFYE